MVFTDPLSDRFPRVFAIFCVLFILLLAGCTETIQKEPTPTDNNFVEGEEDEYIDNGTPEMVAFLSDLSQEADPAMNRYINRKRVAYFKS